MPLTSPWRTATIVGGRRTGTEVDVIKSSLDRIEAILRIVRL